jgi:drug/metabolite transporter (DMT)-like permease
MWAIAAGMTFNVLNSLLRAITLTLHPFETQFLRYFFGLLVMVPLILRSGPAEFIPKNVAGQFWRGAVHTIGLMLWFVALPKVPLADMTAIGFTGPIFTMLGAGWLLRERLSWERWAAAAIGFVGVLVVVGPRLSGEGNFYSLMMLASAPMFSASFLITKALTRFDRPSVIVVWQSLTVSLFTLPLAATVWTWPTPGQWALFVLAGVLGSSGHYCLTRSFAAADISATQSVKFLDLIWATLLGWLVFGENPTQSTLLGGVVIVLSTLWIAHRESRAAAAARERGKG